jgi:response regulator RpfG family c-di-GMP phosphodiesterase
MLHRCTISEKVAIPDAILHKPDSLNEDEWEVMRSHSAIGHKVLAGSQRPLLNAASIIAHQHHEKYDGNGYPHALSGEDIHIYARIVAIADVFDALGSDRIYKKAWPLEKIVALFEEERGSHFDPLLVELFLNHLDEFVAIRDRYTDDIEISKELH